MFCCPYTAGAAKTEIKEKYCETLFLLNDYQLACYVFWTVRQKPGPGGNLLGDM